MDGEKICFGNTMLQKQGKQHVQCSLFAISTANLFFFQNERDVHLIK